MKISAVIIFASVLVWGAPQAQAQFKGCYERIYAKAYLRKHKKQSIIKMRLQIGVGQGVDGPFELLDRIDAAFRNSSIYRGNLIECEDIAGKLECSIESDGGSFVVTDRGNNSLRVSNKNYMRFGGNDSKLAIKAKGDDKEFRLFRISRNACP